MSDPKRKIVRSKLSKA
ncbi:hypothetical protein FWK35_00034374 [Aphis craccivora]|nr:hypothetical protein FWK35_00034374 [Aphis craccivora]